MILNIKANIEGAYHGLGKKYLQRYLDEFLRFDRSKERGILFIFNLASFGISMLTLGMLGSTYGERLMSQASHLHY